VRRVAFDPAAHAAIDATAWARWEKRAHDAAKEMHDWFEARAALPPKTPGLSPRPDFKDAIWGDLKDMLLEAVFRGRCAYCEVTENVGGFGDAEHYRPKRPVEDLDAQGKMRPVLVGAAEHPGYGWLAYDWRNLIPACSKCNTYKANQFPVAGPRVTGPAKGCATTEELNAHEAPLLLHPYFDRPGDALEFGEKGVVAARQQSPRGQATIDVCRLDRDALNTARAREQVAAWREVKELMDQGLSLPDAIQALEARCEAGDEPFSLAVIDYLYLRLAEQIDELKARQAAAQKQYATRRP